MTTKKIFDKEFLKTVPTYFMGMAILDDYISAVQNAARAWGYGEEQVRESVELTLQTLNRGLADVNQNLYIIGKEVTTARGPAMRYLVVSFKHPLSKPLMQQVRKNLEETYENAPLSDLII